MEVTPNLGFCLTMILETKSNSVVITQTGLQAQGDPCASASQVVTHHTKTPSWFLQPDCSELLSWSPELASVVMPFRRERCPKFQCLKERQCSFADTRDVAKRTVALPLAISQCPPPPKLLSLPVHQPTLPGLALSPSCLSDSILPHDQTGWENSEDPHSSSSP